MTRFARIERQGLCDTFERVGPDAPTLCSGWLTRDLAAHLVVRERRPDAAVGMAVPALAGHLERVQHGYAGWGWLRLVEEVRSGPPSWSPASLERVDEAINTAEFFIHHEDVLRAAPGFTPRVLDAPLGAAIWKGLRAQSKLMLRGVTAGVELVAPGFGRVTAKGPCGPGTAVVTGPPGELSLFVAGRQRVADVQVEGPDAAVAAISG